jgi:predicted RNA methylase
VSLARQIAESLSISQEAIILDHCCGTGSFLFSAYQAGYKNIFGADIDEKSVEISKRYIPNGKFIHFDTLGNSHNRVKKLLIYRK